MNSVVRFGTLATLSRCHKESAESANAWHEVAALACLFARLRVEQA